MKNKIGWKLILYFSATLLLFSIIIGSVFVTLFNKHTVELHKSDLENRARTIAASLSDYMSGTGPGTGMMMGGKAGGYGGYLRFLDDIAMTDAWVVNEDLELITGGLMSQSSYHYADLPKDAEAVVKKVFQGNTTFSEGFSELLNTSTLTVGTPILNGEKVIGALLLHSSVERTNKTIAQGLKILAISVAIALMLSILLSIALALSFTKPLKKMKVTAMQLAHGDYSVKTGIKQKDEIGELASVIDLLSKRLDLASKESEKLDKLRRDFVANISHELRTPVTVIRGSLEALCDEVVTEPEQVKSYHSQMLQESLLLQRLVDDLLDLARLQNTDFVMDFQELRLCDIVNDVVRSAKQMAILKNIEIQKVQDQQPCIIQGDYGRLRQMFMIILDNAIKFSSENGIVSVSLKDKTVTIRDYGMGISKEDLPYIFDRFYKVKPEENKIGTGLGLAIVKQIAQRHNVEVFVESEQAEGTEFRLEF